jgi:hypothetical protein
MTLQQLPLKFRLASKDYSLITDSGTQPVLKLVASLGICISDKSHPLG